MSSHKCISALLFLAALTVASSLAATDGGLTGRVADPSGAVLPNVIVTVRNTSTGIAQQTTTTAEVPCVSTSNSRSKRTTRP